MNKVILMGRLTRDPEVRMAGEITVANFSLAVERRFKKDGQPEADFFECTAFRKTAEIAEKYLKKGTKVLVEGELQNDNYTNKDGQKVYRTKVIVNQIEFAESKGASQAAQGGAAQAQKAAPAPVKDDGFMSIPDGVDEELPFA